MSSRDFPQARRTHEPLDSERIFPVAAIMSWELHVLTFSKWLFHVLFYIRLANGFFLHPYTSRTRRDGTFTQFRLVNTRFNASDIKHVTLRHTRYRQLRPLMRFVIYLLWHCTTACDVVFSAGIWASLLICIILWMPRCPPQTPNSQ